MSRYNLLFIIGIVILGYSAFDNAEAVSHPFVPDFQRPYMSTQFQVTSAQTLVDGGSGEFLYKIKNSGNVELYDVYVQINFPPWILNPSAEGCNYFSNIQKLICPSRINNPLLMGQSFPETAVVKGTFDVATKASFYGVSEATLFSKGTHHALYSNVGIQTRDNIVIMQAQPSPVPIPEPEPTPEPQHIVITVEDTIGFTDNATIIISSSTTPEPDPIPEPTPISCPTNYELINGVCVHIIVPEPDSIPEPIPTPDLSAIEERLTMLEDKDSEFEIRITALESVTSSLNDYIQLLKTWLGLTP